MGTILAAVAAAVVSVGAGLAGRLLPAWWGRVARGAALWLGLAVGLAVLAATGTAPRLVVLLSGVALVLGVLDTTLQLVKANWLLRLVVQAAVISATMGWEYLRGDMFALPAAAGALVGVGVFSIVAFACRSAQLSGAGRMPGAMAVLGVGYLALISFGLPNPALTMMTLVAAGAVLPLAVLPAGSADDRALGSVVGGLAWSVGLCAWLGNASPAMVLAPLAIVGFDVIWTLTRRLATVDGRARLVSAGGLWARVSAWGEPQTDLVAQRFATATSVRSACGWLLGSTFAALALSLGLWWLQVPWLLAFAMVSLVALGWLVLQLAAARLSRADSIAWLMGLTVLAVGVATSARLTDGRLVVSAIPVVVQLVVWVAALICLRRGAKPRRPETGELVTTRMTA